MALLLMAIILGTFLVQKSRKSKENITLSPTSASLENEAKSQEKNNIQATAKNYGEASEKYKYQIQVNYPLFDGMDNKEIQDSINSQIEKRANLEIDKYIAEARKNKIAPIFGYLIGNYKYSVISDRTLSVNMEMEKYLSGAPNSQNLNIVLSYNLESGEQIPLGAGGQ